MVHINNCTDCIHFSVCSIVDLPMNSVDDCRFFLAKNKNYSFNVQDTVYYITGIHNTLVKEATVVGLHIGVHGIEDVTVLNEDWVTFTNFPAIFYKTREEAEKHANKQPSELEKDD